MNSKLIFDVGFCLGEDTPYYLKRGFQVLAVEANPELVKQAKQKFATEIKKNNLSYFM